MNKRCKKTFEIARAKLSANLGIIVRSQPQTSSDRRFSAELLSATALLSTPTCPSLPRHSSNTMATVEEDVAASSTAGGEQQ